MGQRLAQVWVKDGPTVAQPQNCWHVHLPACMHTYAHKHVKREEHNSAGNSNQELHVEMDTGLLHATRVAMLPSPIYWQW